MENECESEEEYEENGIFYDFTKKTWRDDVTFIVEGQHLYASKTVLAMASPVFEAMFGSSFRERDVEEVPLPGKSFDGFNEFLHCIYPKSQKKVDRKNVYKVLPLADEYNVKCLIKECKRFLSSHLVNDLPSTQEVLLCHGLAARHEFRNLRKVCATRLSEVGLKAIEATESGIGDTETLLQIHKDILRQQGETLEETRTELVHLYLNKDSSGPVKPLISEEKGAVIRFKPNISLLDVDEQNRKYSSTVTLWGIEFSVFIAVTEREDEKYLSFYLESIFPRNNNYTSCSVSAKIIIWKHPYTEGNICLPLKDHEFTDECWWGFKNFIKLTSLTTERLAENGTLDIVVYLLAKKPSVGS